MIVVVLIYFLVIYVFFSALMLCLLIFMIMIFIIMDACGNKIMLIGVFITDVKYSVLPFLYYLLCRGEFH